MGDFGHHYKKRANIAKNETEVFTAPGMRVLVVDDVKINIKVLVGLLKGTEITVDTAISGPECLDKVKDTHYDLIFLDHLMPNMDGIETLHRMKEMQESANLDTPVIALTANAIVGSKEMYLDEGFNEYLSKPVEQSALIELIRSFLK